MCLECVNQSTEWVRALAQPLAIVVAAILAYWFAVRKLRKETREGLQKAKYDKMLEANQKAWSLLAFITDKENANSLYTFTRQGKKDTFFIHKRNAERFLEVYAELLFAQGSGLFLSQDVIALFAECRGIVYGFLLKEKNNVQDTVKVENEEMITTIHRIYEELIAEIRQSVEITESRKLPK